MIKKLRKRFVLINMSIVTCMLVIILGMVIHFTENDLDANSDTMLQRLAQNALDPGSPETDMQLPYFTLKFNTKGEFVASGKTHLDISDPYFIAELLTIITEIDSTSGYIQQYNLKYTVVTTPGIQVVAFLDVSSHQATLFSLLRTSLIIAAAALAAFTLISILLARWTVNPVETAWKQQKQFISDASHELKTPLTVILSNAELLQSPDCTTENRQQYSDNILHSSTQMRHLVEGMLELARADNGQIRKNFQPVAMSKLVYDSSLPFEPVFYENSKILRTSIQPDITVVGSELYLKQLVDILLDNAQKYSDPGITDLQLSEHGRNFCLLCVANPGKPIPKDQLESIFQRFYRSDDARSNTGSFGLGLSIAHKIVQEHGGKIWAESNESGNCFFALLPCQSK